MTITSKWNYRFTPVRLETATLSEGPFTTEFYKCEACGALTFTIEGHSEWHERMYEKERAEEGAYEDYLLRGPK